SHRYGSSSYADYLDFARSDAFVSLAASDWRYVPVHVPGTEPSMRHVGFVSPNYFDVLGLKLAHGRATNPAVPEEIVLSHPFWRRAFGADPAVLGRTFRIASTDVTIVGVAPESYKGLAFGAPVIGWTSVQSPALVDRDVV